jgi:heterodisulfide reductase subunit A
MVKVVEREYQEGAVLVVGGGVGGMRAAMDLAEAGLKVYLIEQEATLGGRVAQLGYMFPTHDCVLCRGSSDHGYGCTRPAISPAFMDHNLHPNIEIMTRTEIADASGQAGDFTVILRRNPRYVSIERCTNCGLCALACPVRLPSQFQAELVTEKAIHKSAPRSLPDTFFVEKGDYCQDCRRCEEVCPTGAVNLDEEPWEEVIHVAAIILAVGYQLADPGELEELGYGRYPNVVNSMQYERYVSRSGPTDGLVLRPSDNQPPKRIAWLQCIGSRDQEHPYCSSICCMYATKEAVLAKERLPGDVHCQIFMMDERAFNKEFNAYFHRSFEEYGVEYTRCRISQLREDPDTHDLFVRYQDEQGEMREERFNMVVLSVGTRPPAAADTLSRTLGFELNQYGFCQTDKFTPLETSQPGIYVCGAFASPKEIAETIIDAVGAAGDVMRLFHDNLGGLPSSREYPFLSDNAFPPERDVSGEPPRIGVFVCRCYPTLEGVLDIERLLAAAEEYPNVAYAAEIGYGCFPEGQAAIKEAIARHNLNRVVVAACSHRTHQSLFQRVVREAGLNPYLMEMVNIREHCAWVHSRQPQAAMRKAKELVRMAVGRAALLAPLHKMAIGPVQRALIVGGGVSGMTAALAIADAGFDVTLVERDDALGGNLRHIYYVAEGDNPQRLLRDLVNRVRGHTHIEVHTRTELVRHDGHLGAYRSTLRRRDGVEHTVEHAVTIVATGGQEVQGTQHLLGQHPQVSTQLNLEEVIAHRPAEIAKLKEVVMIQCVRPEGVEYDYCSRTCCTNTLKNALRIKQMNGDCQITVLYKDIITYGFREQYYTEARRQGVLFVRYSDENAPQVEDADGRLRITVREPMLNVPLVMEPDLLVLSMATGPSEGTKELAEILGVPLSSEGFFLEAHVKMRPMDFVEEGIFVCGMAHYPKFIEECISQALSTAGRAITYLCKHPLHLGDVVAEVDQSKCVGCLTCVRTCPFEIPQIDHSKSGVGNLVGAAYIEPTLCQGCGTCVAECPAKAIQLRNFRDEQIVVPEMAVLGSWVE